MCIHAWIFLRVLRSQNQQLKKRIEQASLLSLAAIFDTLFSVTFHCSRIDPYPVTEAL